LGTALLSIVLSIITFGLTRQNLYSQREQTSIDQAELDAARITGLLSSSTSPEGVQSALQAISRNESTEILLRYNDQWYSAPRSTFNSTEIPQSVSTNASSGTVAHEFGEVDGQRSVIVGVPLEQLNGQLYTATSLQDIEETLRSLTLSLLGAAALTTVAGAIVGYWATRRVFAPLQDVGNAAESIAGGRLDTRLPIGRDRDLDVIAGPFNEMAQALEDRIERDARFASEVSHELRSPLMTLAASIEVLENSKDEMTERAQTALHLLAADVDRLQQLVDDLLEISRFDVGAITLHREDVTAVEVVMQAVGILGGGKLPVTYDPDVTDVVIRVDKRRFARVMANLLDNAQKYAGGATEVTIDCVDDMVQIGVEDSGDGVSEEERDIIFDRFSRGREGGNRSGDSGVGLGLALVDEHIRLHGGKVWVEERRDGQPGARFVVELPIVEPPLTEEDENAET
jgi:signal transduction histidine kinase